MTHAKPIVTAQWYILLKAIFPSITSWSPTLLFSTLFQKGYLALPLLHWAIAERVEYHNSPQRDFYTFVVLTYLRANPKLFYTPSVGHRKTP